MGTTNEKKRIACDATGLTLIEAMIAITVLAAVTAMFAVAVFQILSIQRTWRAEVLAIRDLRHAGSWFAGDALNAATTTLVDGAASTTSVTLNWTDVANTTYSITYSLSGSAAPYKLLRESGGSSLQMSDKVVDVGFSISGNVVTFDLTVEGAGDETRTKSLDTYLRSKN